MRKAQPPHSSPAPSSWDSYEQCWWGWRGADACTERVTGRAFAAEARGAVTRPRYGNSEATCSQTHRQVERPLMGYHLLGLCSQHARGQVPRERWQEPGVTTPSPGSSLGAEESGARRKRADPLGPEKGQKQPKVPPVFSSHPSA